MPVPYTVLTSTTPTSLYKNFTDSNLLVTGVGVLVAIVVNSSNTATLKIWDNTSAATTVMFNTITVGATERYIPLFGAKSLTGIYITVGGTLDATAIYNI